jgi:methylated-DNA-[protein]-cysteine S-methyltransferase
LISSCLVVSTLSTSAGWLRVEHDERFIYRSVFTEQIVNEGRSKLRDVIAEELYAYQNNAHHRFQLSLKPLGTLFQQEVWKQLLVIPVGRTITYGELANQLQSSPRAIGQACKKNPLAIFIPCHRVVGKGNLGGYMGSPCALPYKIKLLRHESNAPSTRQS